MKQAIRQEAVRVLPDGRVLPQDAATFCGYSPQSMANMRSQGRGPRFVKVGSKVFYYLEDLRAWINGANEAA